MLSSVNAWRSLLMPDWSANLFLPISSLANVVSGTSRWLIETVCSHPDTMEHINSFSLSCQLYLTVFIFRWILSSIKERRPEDRAYSITGREKEFSIG